MISKKKYNLTAQETKDKLESRKKLFEEKEKVFLKRPWQGYCDNSDHPLFSIRVSVDKPVAACYYCSKCWILDA